MLLRHCGLDPQSPENKEILKQVQDDVVVTFHSGHDTTIFWKSDIIISNNEVASLEFYTSDFPTTYSVVIEGLTAEGQIIRQVEKIWVE